jgi:predicted transcriptional regulator
VARLQEGEKEIRQQQLQYLLHRYAFGLSEAEIAQELDWQRRTVNNYLRELAGQGYVYKDGRYWLVDE